MEDPDKKAKKTKDPVFGVIIAFTAIAFAFNLLAFVVPFWIERKAGSFNKLESIGLWVVCFDGYIHYMDDLYNKAYYGCWYIYHKEFDAVKYWLNPTWLYAVQVMCILGFITHLANLLLVSCQSCRILSTTNVTVIKILMCNHLFSGIALLVALLAFGIESNDSRWMPNPEMNTLSWAYAFAAISFITTCIALATLIYFYLVLTADDHKPEKSGIGENAHLTISEEREDNPADYDPRGNLTNDPEEMENVV